MGKKNKLGVLKSSMSSKYNEKHLLVIYELMNYLFANQLGLMISNKHILFTIVSHFDKCLPNVIFVTSIFFFKLHGTFPILTIVNLNFP